MGKVKILMMTDLAGVAGVMSFDDLTVQGRYYERSKYLLTGEVNAAIEGVLAAGDAEVLVMDGHGNEGINFEELHPEAKLIAGQHVFRWLELQNYDALMFVGQHARNGAAQAHLNHTMDAQSVVDVTINGISVGEFGIWAGYLGHWDVPAIFLSGDTAACREAAELVLNITTVPVKEGLERNAAIHLTHRKALERIKKGAQIAIENRKQVKPLHFAPIFRVTIEYLNSAIANQVADQKNGKLLSARVVSFELESFLDVARLWLF